ncbi:alpha/beta hydrolase family protein [Mariniflexile sp. AS56]|uniref:alpha/beta hydrolase family protein n=1 Tax=Mariniflexile sp. AS56 TaxID=3063957 RepID=UPI0026F20D92|nr:dienelactone hydrolase family protein [Mariniflexile sp. AS56]MDO7173697.1 dienelactone hydrolase family protein [Mariniflexile sp. AS56]
MIFKNVIIALLFIMPCILISQNQENDTFITLNEARNVPQNFHELWSHYDPRKEPLDTEILKEWEENGFIFKVLRYRVGVFKGKKAMVAAIYGYPKNASNLPGLVQIHGGGQYADYRAVLTNAKRGYATISISWAGRINAPEYKVTPKEVKLFWAGKTKDANYKITTDWGKLDGYHAPTRYSSKGGYGGSLAPEDWSLDSVDSPKNSRWFLAALAGRRALTFLENQPQVNANKLGVYGHSMGGKLTVLTATDSRVKVAVPSCGGISDNDNDIYKDLYKNTIGDNSYLKEIKCPILFLSPSNDFHGHLKDIPNATSLINTDDWRVVSSAHMNHKDLGEYEVSGLLWMDQYLKGSSELPKTPESKIKLNTKNKIPLIEVLPDNSKPIIEVDIYYTFQGEISRATKSEERENRIKRYWNYANTVKAGDKWKAELPLIRIDKPVWVYANIKYRLGKPQQGAGYYYNIYKTDKFNISTPIQVISPEDLKKSKTVVTDKPSLIIEDFKGNWEKEWFYDKKNIWGRSTHKPYSTKYKAPKKARLGIELISKEANKMVILLDDFASELILIGGSEPQKLILSPKDFKNIKGESLKDFTLVKELSLLPKKVIKGKKNTSSKTVKLGGEWNGKKPIFKKMYWVK